MKGRFFRGPASMPFSNKRLKEIAAWHKKKQRLILIGMSCMAVYLLFSFFFGEMGLIHFSKMKTARYNAQQEIALLEKQNNALLAEMVALKTDSFYLESLARERLGFIKEGELTYEFYPLRGGGEPPAPVGRLEE